METLFTPWRLAYIRGEKSPVNGCLFCNAAQENDDAALIVARSTHVYALLNRYPYTIGHVMIVPYAHVDTLEALDADSLLDLMQTANGITACLRQVYRPHAFNIGANIGQAAGAGIADHVHLHIVPRWQGESNFISTIGGARMIPDTLEHTLTELRAAWRALTGETTADA